MSDIYHEFGDDLIIGSNGDLLIVDGTQEIQQRVIRRLLTNPGDAFFDAAYGAGLPAFVGQPTNATQINAIVKSNMYKETGVQQNPPPVVQVTTQTDNTVILNIRYVDNDNVTSELTLDPGEN